MRVARVLAQAKVNLVLRVGPRDASGYHEIETLFQRIDLADEIVVRAGGASRMLECSGPQLPAAGLGAPEQNLAYRAAVAYAERALWPRGFSIELSKRIPVGGGLGGGSADAAAVLRALDALSKQPLGPGILGEVAAKLGADVPFLVSDYVTSMAVGRGDVLGPPHTLGGPLPPREVIVLTPPFTISTAEAYRWLDDERGSAAPVLQAANTPVSDLGSGWKLVELFSENDFEPVVERRHPEIGNLRRQLERMGARIARLSGSGSCVYGIFEGSAPLPQTIAVDALIITTRTSSRVVQVEVLE